MRETHTRWIRAFSTLTAILIFVGSSMAHADLLGDIQSEHDKAMKNHDKLKQEHAEAETMLKDVTPLFNWAKQYVKDHERLVGAHQKQIKQHEAKMTAHKNAKDPTLAELRDSHNKLLAEHKAAEKKHDHVMDDFDDFAAIIKKLAKFKDEITEHKLKEKTKAFHQ